MLSPDTKKRLSRIRRRATVEVQAAYTAGKISARKADQLLYLPEDRQRAELERILSDQEDIKRRRKIAVEVIRRHLALGRRDLVALQEDLNRALASLTVKTHA
jgi:hypothetical protein